MTDTDRTKTAREAYIAASNRVAKANLELMKAENELTRAEIELDIYRHKVRRATRSYDGSCNDCGARARYGAYCDACRQKHEAEAKLIRREEAKQSGICMKADCLEPVHKPGAIHCRQHNEQYRLAAQQKARHAREQGQCIYAACKNPLSPRSSSYCAEHLAQRNEQRRARKARASL